MSVDGIARCARVQLATLPTPLERGPELDGGVRLWVKRDDLTGLGLGGNKARKLEFLCGEARAAGADCLVTGGAAQSNHCRMTAAAGAILGLETHLVLSGDRPERLTGNVLLADGFGAHLHFTGAAEENWGELEIAREALTDELVADGATPYSIPIGGSTPHGALGYLAAFGELMDQCDAAGIAPAAVVVASSSGGTHAGLVAGRAAGRAAGRTVPDVLAVGVSRGVVMGMPDIVALASDTLALAGHDPRAVLPGDVEVDDRWLGSGYAVPSDAADAAIRAGAAIGGWVFDRTYTGKGFAGLVGNAAGGRWPRGSDVVFVHTGGIPAIFADGGWPGSAMDRGGDAASG